MLKKREKAQLNKIRNERGGITTELQKYKGSQETIVNN